jgi:hypothetical protein
LRVSSRFLVYNPLRHLESGDSRSGLGLRLGLGLLGRQAIALRSARNDIRRDAGDPRGLAEILSWHVVIGCQLPDFGRLLHSFADVMTAPGMARRPGVMLHAQRPRSVTRFRPNIGIACVEAAQGPWRSSWNQLGATAQAAHSEWGSRARICHRQNSDNAEVFTPLSLPSVKEI